MKDYAKNIGFLVLLSLFSGFGLRAQSPAEMTLDEFKAGALKAKNEIWVVDFWASWCRPCIAEIPEVKEIQKRQPGAKVRFISISHDEEEADWRYAMEKLKMPWTQILIPDPSAPDAFLDKNFPHQAIPSMWIILPNGKVKRTDSGMLEAHLSRILKKM